MIKSIDQILLDNWGVEDNVIYRLHSRFNHAMNWVNIDREMITFLTRDLPNAPNTLLIDMASFQNLNLSESAVFMKNSDGYFIDGNKISDGLSIAIWVMNVPTIHNVESETLKVMNDFLDRNCEETTGIETKIYEKLDENYQKLIEACGKKSYEEITSFARQCIGLGLGLTPSGDDRLVGFLLGCYTQSEKNQNIIKALQSAIDVSIERTNEISYAMLKMAREGRFNEWLLQLAKEISQNHLDEIPLAMQKVFAIGSRSGGDMLKGLVLSLEMNLD